MVTYTEHELLVLLCAFLANKQIVYSDEESIRDMTSRYKNPPFTVVFPACMRMTMQDTNRLNELLKQAYKLLSANEVQTVDTP
jgi:hypothetical protein